MKAYSTLYGGNCVIFYVQKHEELLNYDALQNILTTQQCIIFELKILETRWWHVHIARL